MFFFFATIFFTVQKGRNIYRGGGGGGGGCNFLLFIFFFFGGGGVGGGRVQILISIETYITFDFSGGGGGGGSGPHIPLWIRAWVRISNCPLPCHGLSFLKVSEGLPAGAVGNLSDYFFFFWRWGGGGGGGGANAYFQLIRAFSDDKSLFIISDFAVC